MTYLNIDPRLDPIRSDTRFIDFLHRMRLTKLAGVAPLQDSDA